MARGHSLTVTAYVLLAKNKTARNNNFICNEMSQKRTSHLSRRNAPSEIRPMPNSIRHARQGSGIKFSKIDHIFQDRIVFPHRFAAI